MGAADHPTAMIFIPSMHLHSTILERDRFKNGVFVRSEEILRLKIFDVLTEVLRYFKDFFKKPQKNFQKEPGPYVLPFYPELQELP